MKKDAEQTETARRKAAALRENLRRRKAAHRKTIAAKKARSDQDEPKGHSPKQQ